jgi:1,4-dihydroxy-2-naphthoate octaprenyltransferase
METESQRPRLSFQTVLTLVAGLAVVGVILIWVPASRWFVAISIPIGGIFAGIFYLWHKLRPVKNEEVDHRPLKLD